ncbi:hypothetical protein L2E82_32311 [Cichorium intybus]|uniref:Uncharacterized protein n=1 Tax=Cichorium intybus TaxID=13427 RepID=A0ACB9BGV9_CICIN|nr:hypothetical protein L2E82_32311 [Cichorium intybus]
MLRSSPPLYSAAPQPHHHQTPTVLQPPPSTSHSPVERLRPKDRKIQQISRTVLEAQNWKSEVESSQMAANLSYTCSSITANLSHCAVDFLELP